MRNLAVLFIHFIAVLARLSSKAKGPGGGIVQFLTRMAG